MTEAEKKMKKYTAAIACRLNMPREMRERVMSDFASSIQARKDAGKTDEEILEELGSPRQAAAELNEQMKDFTYRKSPWRFLFAACAIYGAVELLGALWTCIVYLFMKIQTPSGAASVGIIGGADGPTSIFVTAPPWLSYIIPTLLLIAGIYGYLRLSRCKRQ